MKTAASSYNLEMPQGNYYIEDLYKIYELLNMVTEEVKIKTERYEFASFEDLKKFDGKIRKIFFISSNPFINIEIDKRVIIHSNKDNPITRGIIEQIESLIKEKAVEFNSKSKKYNLLSSLIFSVFIGITLLNILKEPSSINKGLISLSLILVAWLYYGSMGIKSSVKLIPNREKPSFRSAKLDKLT